MQKYNDIDNDSNIDEFEINDDYIVVKFLDGKTYKYTYLSAGSLKVEEMKKFALSHDGLNSFINKQRPKYESKWN
ncbi:MAG: hypothetical protein WCW04_01020 [Candidatus Paceibacterota bacterium]